MPSGVMWIFVTHVYWQWTPYLEVRKEVAPYLDLQLVAFPQDGYLRDTGAAKLMETALDSGVDVVGGIPHF